MNVLAIGAHPDDIEIGCGGALLRLARMGHHVYLLVMTEGQRGGEKEIRTQEQESSSALLKPRETFWGGFVDTELASQMNRLVQTVEGFVKKVNPDLIFVHYEDDTHQDHRALAKAAVSATRYVRNVLFYEGPTTQHFSPAAFVDIKDVLEDKIALLLSHRSQAMKTNIEGLSIVDIARSTAVFRGIQGRVHYAEGFAPLRYFLKIGAP